MSGDNLPPQAKQPDFVLMQKTESCDVLLPTQVLTQALRLVGLLKKGCAKARTLIKLLLPYQSTRFLPDLHNYRINTRSYFLKN